MRSTFFQAISGRHFSTKTQQKTGLQFSPIYMKMAKELPITEFGCFQKLYFGCLKKG